MYLKLWIRSENNHDYFTIMSTLATAFLYFLGKRGLSVNNFLQNNLFIKKKDTQKHYDKILHTFNNC